MVSKMTVWMVLAISSLASVPAGKEEKIHMKVMCKEKCTLFTDGRLVQETKRISVKDWKRGIFISLDRPTNFDDKGWPQAMTVTNLSTCLSQQNQLIGSPSSVLCGPSYFPSTESSPWIWSNVSLTLPIQSNQTNGKSKRSLKSLVSGGNVAGIPDPKMIRALLKYAGFNAMRTVCRIKVAHVEAAYYDYNYPQPAPKQQSFTTVGTFGRVMSAISVGLKATLGIFSIFGFGMVFFMIFKPKTFANFVEKHRSFSFLRRFVRVKAGDGGNAIKGEERKGKNESASEGKRDNELGEGETAKTTFLLNIFRFLKNKKTIQSVSRSLTFCIHPGLSDGFVVKVAWCRFAVNEFEYDKKIPAYHMLRV
ncbi:hypothetical protein HELRODRAFT_172509 [Helobdella robusta]|uniref:Uncharacterized protein n=1 Tax=Helobdella robusta TaxID=6412 RepID=T1F5F5_HELRO|nr:hypothetical protein HELRODRAFT_172509 [Helobdella robusta]ESO04167.1 hypothetical protein HELRODRAFT_172509 [Helobdella robusta]